MVDSFKVTLSFPDYMLESRKLVKFHRLFGDDLSLYLWCNNLDEKLAVYGRMDFVADIATDMKRTMR